VKWYTYSVLITSLIQITALTNAKDHERLTLLKEVAGTKVYEQRRAESLRIMSDTQSKRAKISELLEYIETRLSELESEKEELKEWTEKDRERRCLEYAMYQRDLNEASNMLIALEEERQRNLDNAKELRDAFGHRERDMQVFCTLFSGLSSCTDDFPVFRE
jgi:structural maintenance of chromosome 3 (chondroitin sulfate proteoglycan 6)